ncbi:MAG: DNA repair protein RecN [Myxococcales bacterium]|nr:DNA repair protein RecN [Myxococcales bacterium]MBP6843307.1 DNA repair protein RecN [Kofleriaceae bacterium]
MLRHLRVTNFAILSDVTLELGPGLGVLTGETGAGKSLIVEAVNLLRGGRASADIPRAGAPEATVEAIVEVPADLRERVRGVLAAGGLPLAADDAAEVDLGAEVVIRRVILRGGKSRTYVNGALTTAGRLAELGAWLIDLAGQHQHQGLVDARRHREILDAFAGDAALPAEMAAAWDELGGIDAQIAALGGDDRQRAERADFVRFQKDELDAARLEPGEDERLVAERTRLSATEELRVGSRAAVAALDGGDGDAGALDGLAHAARELDKLVRLDATLDPLARQLAEARVIADDATAGLRRYADRVDGDPERLAWIDDRLEQLRRLRRKHGGGDLLDRLAALTAELDQLTHKDAHLESLTAARAQALGRCQRAAAALTDSRRRAGTKLAREVGKALAELGMASARLEVRVAPAALGPHGADEVEVLLGANKGEELKPLAKVASGGELSRIMLAMKLALRRADEVATYVFDEVDAGIGGATAHAVGALIRAVADHRQVLCVTHLPQIAAYADAHYHVEKVEAGGRTETLVKRLGSTARKDELARMLGGSTTARAKAHAAELLDSARRPRAQA